MKQEWQAFWLALGFLTRIPMLVKIDYSQRLMNRASVYFPLVGLLLGGLYAALYSALVVFWSPPVCIGLVLAFHLWITGAFHEDGLADSMDALGGGYTVARRLEIMKDSRIGTMGALGQIVVLLLKIGALLSLGEAWWLGAVLAPVWGRWADIYGIFWFPVASADGLARTFRQQVRRSDFALATLFSLGVSLALNFPWGGVVLLVIGPVIPLCARAMVRTLGGLTGDTYGALCELGEVLTLLFLPPSIISNCFSTRLFGRH